VLDANKTVLVYQIDFYRDYCRKSGKRLKINIQKKRGGGLYIFIEHDELLFFFFLLQGEDDEEKYIRR